MRINEVAEQIGMAKKNIRFYESEGLITPGRESGNGYRTYTEADVERLRRIKLLRQLDVPLAECRAMLDGRMTLADGMRRHIVTLHAREKDLAGALQLCQALQEETDLDGVDMDALQARLEEEQRRGVKFMDVQKQDIRRKRTVGALIGGGLFILMMLVTVLLIAWGQSEDPLPLGLLAVVLAFPVVCIIGTAVVLYQRIKEIRKDEIDAYRDY